MREVWPYLVIILILGTITLLSKYVEENILSVTQFTEGFENQEEVKGAVTESKGLIKWLNSDELYDSFYAKIYDQLTQGSVRTQAEIGMMLHEWSKRGEDITKFEILDGGCGTGIAVAALAKMNVKRVVGIDTSEEMIKHAEEVVIEQSTLTKEQKKHLEFRKGDLIDPSICAPGEFSHVCLLYFTIYYFKDKEALFRNLFLWVKPGGKMCIQVVNKHKFDPMLESSTPWMGFSLQKYSKERVTKSEVVFDNFKYIGEFDLTDPQAEFRETFRFKDGKVRRQKHEFRMENIDEIVKMAKMAGWKYDGSVDLTKISAEYFYHLYFSHP